MLPTKKLEELTRRFQELDHLLCTPAVLADHNKLQKLNKERADLEPVIAGFKRYRDTERKIGENKELADDAELGELARAELPDLEAEKVKLEHELELLLLPKDPNDERNTVLEIRSGEGGEEAALFAADIFRMISRYAEGKRISAALRDQSTSS